ncbi:alcohol dehydrogenase catalytic domain-containing protein [Actinomycetaceae bacterium L2_0104]
MKAVEYQGNRSFAPAQKDAVSPRADEVQIRVSYVGLCGTDLHVYLGDMDQRVGPQAIIGHEMSGEVVAVGESVSAFAAGDKVTVLPTDFCGECAACRKGYSNVCYNMNFVGLDSAGALQELWTVPERLVVALPRDIDLRSAALIEPLTVAVHDVRRSNLEEGESALVVGGGPIGILIALVAKAKGANVLLSEPEAGRRATAENLGIDTVDPVNGDLAGAVATFSEEGRGANVVFEVSGTQPGIVSAVTSAAARGRIIEVAIHAADRQINLHSFFWRELEMYGARLYHREDMEEAAQLIYRKKVDVDQLITLVRRAEDTTAAFEALSKGDAMKILIQMN